MKEKRIGQPSCLVCDVGECLRKEEEWGAAGDAQESTVIHTPFVIGAPCCSSSSAVLITSYNHVTLQHIPVASPAKETYF